MRRRARVKVDPVVGLLFQQMLSATKLRTQNEEAFQRFQMLFSVQLDALTNDQLAQLLKWCGK